MLFHACGMSIVIASVKDFPVDIKSSNALSNVAESEQFGVKIGNNSSKPSLNLSDFSTPSLAFIQFLFPIIVFISPLWAKYLKGCAKSQVGNVFVE